jgi:hypothetical protein
MRSKPACWLYQGLPLEERLAGNDRKRTAESGALSLECPLFLGSGAV